MKLAVKNCYYIHIFLTFCLFILVSSGNAVFEVGDKKQLKFINKIESNFQVDLDLVFLF